MKSCLGILIVFTTLIAVLGGGALIWYLSSTAEFSRKATTETTVIPPKAPVAGPTTRPKARPTH